MSGVLLPLADHGDVVGALPFVVPMLLIVLGLVFLVARDRLSSSDAGGEDPASSRS
ncbi:MAG: hypothetical protein ACR2G3_11405 [Solirubrobacterales bacterium]